MTQVKSSLEDTSRAGDAHHPEEINVTGYLPVYRGRERETDIVCKRQAERERFFNFKKTLYSHFFSLYTDSLK